MGNTYHTLLCIPVAESECRGPDGYDGIGFWESKMFKIFAKKWDSIKRLLFVGCVVPMLIEFSGLFTLVLHFQ